MTARLKGRLGRLEARIGDAAPPSAVLVVIEGHTDEEAARAEFIARHGCEPPLVIYCATEDRRLRPDPPD
tara:strand:+ start:158 stop:367 length:210 start_codon:yes stop_codon:yes gene_type:complete